MTQVIGYDSSIELILFLSSALFSVRRIIRYAIQISKNIPNTGFCRGYVLINTCTGVFLLAVRLNLEYFQPAGAI